MAAMARAVYRELAPPDVRDQFTFTLGDLPPAYGDPTLIRQVWSNLISNAIKYTRPSPLHQIEIRGNIEGGRCVYSIRDSGVGFDPEFAGKMFGVFQRLHHGLEFEGSGVGLAIVQRIVRRHGGEAWAEGALNQGATFYFSLPGRSDVTDSDVTE